MKSKFFTSLLLFTFILFVSSSYGAYYGTRPMGMGGAFTAIADDANAAYWNPAGFALNPETSITGSTLLTNRNSVIGDNIAALKMSGTTNMAEIFGWLSVAQIALDSLQFLADVGVIKDNPNIEGKLKANVGRDVKKTSREESFAEQVKKGPQPLKPPAPKTDEITGEGQRTRVYGYEQPHYSQRNYYFNSGSDRSGLSEIPAEFALGLTWLYDNNPVMDQNSNWYTISFASGKKEKATVGMNINIYDLKIPSIDVKGFGAGIDFGVILKPASVLSLGLVAKEAFTTDIKWQNGASTRHEMLINGGIALTPVDGLTLAVDAHNFFSQNMGVRTMHYGAEFRPVKEFALRGGLFDNSKTAGTTIGLPNFNLDYAYLGGTFDKTQMASVNYKF